jgi:hypothetical protein
MNKDNKLVNTIIGMSLIGAAAIGVVSFIAALFPFFSEDYAAAGLMLIASALSFGLLSIAVLGR